MKKMMIVTLAMLSATTMAATKTNIKPENTPTAQPTVVLRVLDFSSKTPRPLTENKLSQSKNQQLCWSSVNVPLSGKVQFAEAFYAPAATTFTSEGMSVTASEDKKEFLIVGNVTFKDNTNLTRCWKFTKEDPVGHYRLDVQINDIIFKGLAFEVVK